MEHWVNGTLWFKNLLENIHINPFLANVPISFPLKTPENPRLSAVFRGYKTRILARNELKDNIQIKKQQMLS